jgi:hypothetical protein
VVQQIETDSSHHCGPTPCPGSGKRGGGTEQRPGDLLFTEAREGWEGQRAYTSSAVSAKAGGGAGASGRSREGNWSLTMR